MLVQQPANSQSRFQDSELDRLKAAEFHWLLLEGAGRGTTLTGRPASSAKTLELKRGPSDLS